MKVKQKQKQRHTIISLDAEKPFDKIQSPFMIMVSEISGIKETCLNIIKAIYSKSMYTIISSANNESLTSSFQFKSP